MQIERSNKYLVNSLDMDSAAILDQLVLLTEQYKRLNELLENKQNLLRQRALDLRKRRIKTKRDMHRMWLTLGYKSYEWQDSSSKNSSDS